MNEPLASQGMSLIVKTVTHWVKVFILVFGMYIVLNGHLTPGGGFAGGVVVACAFILLELANGQTRTSQTVKVGVAAELDSAGALLFLGVALVGMRAAGAFFKNFVPTPEAAWFKLFSAGVIPICNIGIGLKVGMSLFLVFVLLSALHVAVRNGDRKMIRRRKE